MKPLTNFQASQGRNLQFKKKLEFRKISLSKYPYKAVLLCVCCLHGDINNLNVYFSRV